MQPIPKPPTPEDTDSEEVQLVLEAAIVLWATGKREECMGAVTQAADCAERAGDAPRAAALRAAADELKATGASASTRPSPEGAARSAPPARAHSHAPPPPSARHAAEARNGARPPSAPSVTRSAPPTSAAPQAPVVESTAPAAPVAQPAPSASNGHARVEGSLHVWVRASARDPSLLLVRVLPDGASAPPGSYEAYLSPTTEGIDLRAPKH